MQHNNVHYVMKYSVDPLAYFLTLHIRGCDTLIVLLTFDEPIIVMDIIILILGDIYFKLNVKESLD